MACSSIHFFLIIFVLPFSALAQNTGVVRVGTRLTADGTSRPWLSQSGDFSFGFKQTQHKELFLLSIWYVKIPDTTVWFLNSIDPVRRGSTLELNAKSGLVLRDPQGVSLWKSEGIADHVSQGVMNDTGNFILKGTDFRWIWQTFAHATDTILPLQEMVYGSKLISRKSETSFSRGRFYIRFLHSGDLVLTIRSWTTNSEDVVYYVSQTSDTSSDGSSSAVRAIFEERGSIYVQRRNNQRRYLTPLSLPSASENYFRATLNFYGVFTVYYHPRIFTGEPNWTPLKNLPNNICVDITGYENGGVCGLNSVCRIDNNSRPVCECPKGYELTDPNEKYGSCTPKSSLCCGGNEDQQYGILKLPNTDWPLKDYQMFTDFTLENCEQACMSDCNCAVAVFRNNTCWKKKLPLSNGRKDERINP